LVVGDQDPRRQQPIPVDAHHEAALAGTEFHKTSDGIYADTLNELLNHAEIKVAGLSSRIQIAKHLVRRSFFVVDPLAGHCVIDISQLRDQSERIHFGKGLIVRVPGAVSSLMMLYHGVNRLLRNPRRPT